MGFLKSEPGVTAGIVLESIFVPRSREHAGFGATFRYMTENPQRHRFSLCLCGMAIGTKKVV
jgi:hypothetical protein